MQKKVQLIGYSNRIAMGGSWWVFGEMAVMLAAHTALVISTGYYLWNYEYDTRGNCNTCNFDYTVTKYGDVATFDYNGICTTDQHIDV